MSTAGKILVRPGVIAASLVRRATSGGVRRHASNLKPANQVRISSYMLLLPLRYKRSPSCPFLCGLARSDTLYHGQQCIIVEA